MFNLTNRLKQYSIIIISFFIYSNVNCLPVFLLLEILKLSTSAWVGNLVVSDDLKSCIDRLPNLLL